MKKIVFSDSDSFDISDIRFGVHTVLAKTKYPIRFILCEMNNGEYYWQGEHFNCSIGGTSHNPEDAILKLMKLEDDVEFIVITDEDFK